MMDASQLADKAKKNLIEVTIRSKGGERGDKWRKLAKEFIAAVKGGDAERLAMLLEAMAPTRDEE